MRLHKIFLPFGLLLMGLVWLACVDPPTVAPPLPEPAHTLARFAHVALGAGSATINIDGNAAGSTSFGQATSYLDFLWGNRIITVGSDSGVITFPQEHQSTVLVYSTGTNLAFLRLGEGDRFRSAAIDTAARVKFVNVGATGSGALSFYDSQTGALLSGGVARLSVPAYTVITPGSRSVFVGSPGAFVADSITGSQEVPPAVSTLRGSATATMTPNGGVSYRISLVFGAVPTTINAAHFHNAVAGANGGVVFTIISAPIGPLSDTTLVIEGVWNDATLTDALRTAFNTGAIYVNFHTPTIPSGEVRGQVRATTAYSVSALMDASEFAAGQSYTVVAVGSGTSTQMIKFTDRRGGLTKATASGL